MTQVPSGAQNAATTTTNYNNGFQYMNSVLQFFPTSEGYVRNTVVSGVSNYNYVYNFTDHLGNIRLSYANDPATNVLKILEENQYYPYGVKHTSYNSNLNAFASKGPSGVELQAVAAAAPGGGGSVTTQAYAYKFNGVEYQDELALDMYDMPLRDYDASSGKWFGMDPVVHYDQSPYMAFNGNPVVFADPSGADGVVPDPTGTVYGMAGQSSAVHYSNAGNSSSIFWGSSAMLFEQSWEAHDPNGKFTTYDKGQITSILTNFGSTWHEGSYSLSATTNSNVLGAITITGGYWTENNPGAWDLSNGALGTYFTALDEYATYNATRIYNYGMRNLHVSEVAENNFFRMTKIAKGTKILGNSLGFVSAGVSLYGAYDEYNKTGGVNYKGIVDGAIGLAGASAGTAMMFGVLASNPVGWAVLGGIATGAAIYGVVSFGIDVYNSN